MDIAEPHLLKQVSRKRDALLGFVLGTSFESHRAHLLEFAQEGFTEPPSALDGTRRVVMVKRDSQGFERAAFVLSYGPDARLVDARLLLSGDAIHDEATARAAAAGLRDAVLECMGAPSVYIDSIEEWARQGAYEDQDASCFSAFWMAGPAANTRMHSPAEYAAALRDTPGPLSSVTISSARGDGMTVASLIVQVRP